MGIDTMILYYENYETQFESTLKETLCFLNLSAVGRISKFVPGRTYHHYYERNELIAAMELVKYVASYAAWNLVQRYKGISQNSS